MIFVNLNAERLAISYLLINANLNIIAKEILEPEDFYDNKMKVIFECFFLSKAPEKLSAIDIAQKTKIDFIELSELMMSVVSQREQEFRSTCYLIKDLSYKRKHEALITKIKKQLSDGADLDDIQAEYDRFFASIDTKQNEILTSQQLAKMTYESFMQNVTNGLKVIKTGYIDFDKIFGGLISDDYIILAARTSVGKSSFAISLCYNLIKQNIRVAYLTLEMQPIAILNKLIAIQQNLPLLEITNPLKENKIDAKIIAGCEFIRDSNIIVETARGKNDLYVKSKIRKYAELGAKIVVIDLLDKIKSSEKAEKRQIQLANISRSLFEASKEYNIIVLALVQLNREAAKTEKPMLHHLREAGDFEQDADVVLLLDRPEQQDNVTFWDKSDATGKARLIKAKDRMGATGFIDLGFNKQTTYFHDLNYYNRYENEIQAF